MPSPDLLLVIRYSAHAPGAVATAYELRTGLQRWETTLAAAGNTKPWTVYRNVVTTRRRGARLIIEGRELAGHYTEEIDIATGTILSNQRRTAQAPDVTPTEIPPRPSATPPEIPGQAQAAAFHFDGTAPRPARSLEATNSLGLRCTYTNTRTATLRCFDVFNKEQWRIELATPKHGAALAVTDQLVAYATVPLDGQGPATLATYQIRTGQAYWQHAIATQLPSDAPPAKLDFLDVDMRLNATTPAAAPNANPSLELSIWSANGKLVQVFDAKAGRCLGLRAEP